MRLAHERGGDTWTAPVNTTHHTSVRYISLPTGLKTNAIPIEKGLQKKNRAYMI
jgi:hypothetical protein